MRNSVYRISLEMHDTASQALLNVKKNDSSRQVRISITDSGKPYKIEDGCTAKFRAKKPDGTILYNNCIIENDVIIYDLTNQTSAAAGLVDCEITLYGADFKQITSPRFAIYVDDTLYSDSEVESKDEFTALVTAEKTAVSAAQSAKEAETNANQSALLAEQYKNEAFKVTPAGFTEFVETTNDTLNEIGNLLGNTDISAIGDGTVTGGLDALNSNLYKVNNPVMLYDISSNSYNANDFLCGNIDMSAYSGFLIYYSDRVGGYQKSSYFTGNMSGMYQALDFTNNNDKHYFAGVQVRGNGLFVEIVGANKPFIVRLYGIPA